MKIATNAAEYDPAYRAAQPKPVQDLMALPYGLAKVERAMALVQKGYLIDNAIMVWNWGPFYTMTYRQQYGYSWVPSAGMPPVSVAPGITFNGQHYDPAIMPKGGLLVTLDLDQLKTLFPAPGA